MELLIPHSMTPNFLRRVPYLLCYNGSFPGSLKNSSPRHVMQDAVSRTRRIKLVRQWRSSERRLDEKISKLPRIYHINFYSSLKRRKRARACFGKLISFTLEVMVFARLSVYDGRTGSPDKIIRYEDISLRFLTKKLS